MKVTKKKLNELKMKEGILGMGLGGLAGHMLTNQLANLQPGVFVKQYMDPVQGPEIRAILAGEPYYTMKDGEKIEMHPPEHLTNQYRDAYLKHIGGSAGGTAAGAYLGHALEKRFKKKKDKEEESVEESINLTKNGLRELATIIDKDSRLNEKTISKGELLKRLWKSQTTNEGLTQPGAQILKEYYAQALRYGWPILKNIGKWANRYFWADAGTQLATDKHIHQHAADAYDYLTEPEDASTKLPDDYNVDDSIPFDNNNQDDKQDDNQDNTISDNEPQQGLDSMYVYDRDNPLDVKKIATDDYNIDNSIVVGDSLFKNQTPEEMRDSAFTKHGLPLESKNKINKQHIDELEHYHYNKVVKKK